MSEIKSVCPECGTENELSLLSMQEHLDRTELELEQPSVSGNLKSVIADLENVENKQLHFPVQLPIECKNENCGCDYDIQESKNWDEIKKYFMD